MTDIATIDDYGTLSEPMTLTIQRLLPGPIERVWAYLTDSDLRKQWLAAGEMEARIGAALELVWRNDELMPSPGQRPDGFPEEHRMVCEVTACDPPHKLAITWGRSGGVSFELQPKGQRVLLTLVHHRLPDRDSLLNVSGGWHAHLDVLADRLSDTTPEPFWDSWRRLKADYEKRFTE